MAGDVPARVTGRLVYPAPMPAARVWLYAGCYVVAMAAVVALAVRLDAPGAVVGGLTGAWVAVFVGYRRRTVVTPDRIVVRGVFRTRELPVGELRDVVHAGIDGRRVLVGRDGGGAVELPRVAPADIGAISGLTGLPVRPASPAERVPRPPG